MMEAFFVPSQQEMRKMEKEQAVQQYFEISDAERKAFLADLCSNHGFEWYINFRMLLSIRSLERRNDHSERAKNHATTLREKRRTPKLPNY
jgi:hypothetical protein